MDDIFINTESPGWHEPQGYSLLCKPLFKKVGEWVTVTTVARFGVHCRVMNLGSGSDELGYLCHSLALDPTMPRLPLLYIGEIVVPA